MQVSNALSMSGNKRSREENNDSQSSNNQLQLISSTKDLTSLSTSYPHIQPINYFSLTQLDGRVQSIGERQQNVVY